MVIMSLKYLIFTHSETRSIGNGIFIIKELITIDNSIR